MTDNDGARVHTSPQYNAARPRRGFPCPTTAWCRWIRPGADPESTWGHYNKRSGPSEWASAGSGRLERENHSGNPCGETTLTQSSVSVTAELDLLTHTWRTHRHTYAHRVGKPGQSLQYLLCCVDVALDELIVHQRHFSPQISEWKVKNLPISPGEDGRTMHWVRNNLTGGPLLVRNLSNLLL